MSVKLSTDLSLDWSFILAVVDKAGMSGLLSRFLKASSHILLNGRPTQAIRLMSDALGEAGMSPDLHFVL